MLRSHRTTVIGLAVLAVLAFGGTATAAKLITGKQVKNGSLTGADVRDGAVGTGDLAPAVRAGLAFRAPAGPAGPAGPKGDTGPQGPAGTPDGYTAAEADNRFLAMAGRAADASLLDGETPGNLLRGDATIGYRSVTVTSGSAGAPTIPLSDALGYLQVDCDGANDKRVVLASGPHDLVFDTTVVRDNGATTVLRNTIPAGEGIEVHADEGNYSLIVSVLRPAANGNPLAAADLATVLLTATDVGAECRFDAETVVSERDQASLVINP